MSAQRRIDDSFSAIQEISESARLIKRSVDSGLMMQLHADKWQDTNTTDVRHLTDVGPANEMTERVQRLNIIANEIRSSALIERIRSSSFLHANVEMEGIVEDINVKTFTARMRRISETENTPDLNAKFDISDVAKGDFDLLQAGAIFRWVVGYERSRTGTTRRVSQIVFRRLPAWTKNILDNSAARAEQLLEGLQID